MRVSKSALDRMVANGDARIATDKRHPSRSGAAKPRSRRTAAPKRPKVWQNERQFMAACFHHIHGELSAIWPELCMAHHVANENAHHHPGVVGGLPDIHIPLQRGGYAGLWIELKVNGNTPTEKQRDMMAALRSVRHQAHWVEDDLDEVIRIVREYMSLPAPGGIP